MLSQLALVARGQAGTTGVVSNLSMMDHAIKEPPEQYRTVLTMLRAIRDWPATSKARQERIVGSNASQNFSTGEPGADIQAQGGSFTIGAMPTGPGLRQPAANQKTWAPSLLRACLELERVIMPERKPSSTVVVNRNAQCVI